MTDAKAWIREELDVSRETLGRLESLVELTLKWTPKINLISKSTVDGIWARHVLDSAQLAPFAPDGLKTWVDLGSGGGYPGLVLAVLLDELRPEASVHMIESDQRKSTFLRTAIRELGLTATAHAIRAEALDPMGADIVSARALAPLEALLKLLQRHGRPDARGVFPKGRQASREIDAAARNWSFTCLQHPSITDPEATLLEIGDLGERGSPG